MELNGNALTVGNVTQLGQTSNNLAYWNWPYQDTYVLPYQNITYQSWPAYCCGDVHVFGCEHADKCKCGKASRKLEPKKCASCGK